MVGRSGSELIGQRPFATSARVRYVQWPPPEKGGFYHGKPGFPQTYPEKKRVF